MLTYRDCLDWCDLEQNEVDAISEHQHMDRILALAYGSRLTSLPGGTRKMRKIMIDDIRNAQQHYNAVHAAELRRMLDQYIKAHPL